MSTNATNSVVHGNPSGAHCFTHGGRSFSFVLVYLCIYTMLGFCILIVHAMERFFGIGVVYASTRFTQKGRRGCDSLSWVYNYLWDQCLSPLKFEFEPRTWRGVLDTILCDKICQ